MRYMIVVIALLFGTLLCFAAKAEKLEPPRIILVHFFCITPGSVHQVAEAMQASEKDMMAVAEKFEAGGECFFSQNKVPLLGFMKGKPFNSYTGETRHIFGCMHPNGQQVFIIAPPPPPIGEPT